MTTADARTPLTVVIAGGERARPGVAAALMRQLTHASRLAMRLPGTLRLDKLVAGGASAIESADFLIVIGSPHAREDALLAAAIGSFLQRQGEERLLLVLAGDSVERSFPQDLLDQLSRVIEHAAAAPRRVLDTYVPQVVVNGRTRQALVRDAALRLAAHIFDRDYDDIARRQVVQRRRRWTAAAVVAVLVAAGGFATRLYLRSPRVQIAAILEEAPQREVTSANDVATLATWAAALDSVGLNDRAKGVWSDAFDRANVGGGVPVTEIAPAWYDLAAKLTLAGRYTDAQGLRDEAKVTVTAPQTLDEAERRAQALAGVGERTIAVQVAFSALFNPQVRANEAPRERPERIARKIERLSDFAGRMLIEDEQFEAARLHALRDDDERDRERLLAQIARESARRGRPSEVDVALEHAEVLGGVGNFRAVLASLAEEASPELAERYWREAIDIVRALPTPAARCVALDQIAGQLELAGRSELADPLREQLRRELPVAAASLPTLTREHVNPNLPSELGPRLNRERNPDPLHVFMTLASLLAREGQTARADAMWNAARALLPQVDDAALLRIMLGDSLRRGGRLEEALVLEREHARLTGWTPRYMLGGAIRDGQAAEAAAIVAKSADDELRAHWAEALVSEAQTIAVAVRKAPQSYAAIVVDALAQHPSMRLAVTYGRLLEEVDGDSAARVVTAGVHGLAAVSNRNERCEAVLGLAQLRSSAALAPELRSASSDCSPATRLRIAAALLVTLHPRPAEPAAALPPLRTWRTPS